MPEENEPVPPRRGRLKPVSWLVWLILGFLAGFVWQFTRAQKLESEALKMKQSLAAYEKETVLSGLRDGISLTYFEVARKNYGLAGERFAGYFDQLRALSDANKNPELKQDFDSLLSMCNRVAARLSAGDPAVNEPLQEMLLSTYRITKPPNMPAGGPSQ